ncbi:hypothetical protein E2C01_040971 [Portunus trituberculatus]|uniref:Uncharacterized protein n=1 Tax=Portunus trituberculatus TaxID=210409 RepID=A0A5B7FHZ0_PORTR|nr:hypothetical protein [Portunus trituberculatus]
MVLKELKALRTCILRPISGYIPLLLVALPPSLVTIHHTSVTPSHHQESLPDEQPNTTSRPRQVHKVNKSNNRKSGEGKMKKLGKWIGI